MSDFKAIETQEEFDKAIKARLAQKDRELAEQYKDYLSPDDVKAMKADYDKQLQDANKLVEDAKKNLADHEKIVSELTTRATTAETSLLKTKVAHANKLPLELADRLIGSNEEELKKDAESLASLLKPGSPAPLRTTETGAGAPGGNGNNNAAFLGLLNNLTEQLNS